MCLRYNAESRRKYFCHTEISGQNYTDNRELLKVTYSHRSIKQFQDECERGNLGQTVTGKLEHWSRQKGHYLRGALLVLHTKEAL